MKGTVACSSADSKFDSGATHPNAGRVNLTKFRFQFPRFAEEEGVLFPPAIEGFNEKEN